MLIGAAEVLIGFSVLATAPAITQQIAGFILIGFGFLTAGIGEIARVSIAAARTVVRIEGRLIEMETNADARLAPVVAASQRLNGLGRANN